jgi:hypothetical protein
MSPKPGLIILLGSGETSASIRKVYHWLFEQFDTAIRLGILETPAGFEPNSDRVAGEIGDFMKKRLQNFNPQVSIIPARKRGTPFSPDNPDLLAPLLQANVIMMGPGSPTYAVRQLHNSLAWQTLIARHRLGAAVIFASAATVACSIQALPVYEIYKVGEELHWKTGLNFFAAFGLPLVFIPHWNNNDGGSGLDTSRCYMGQSRFMKLVELLPDNPAVVGIDERTALIIDPAGALCRVMGVGSTTLVREGQLKTFVGGESFPASELGPFRPLTKPQSGLAPEVWQRVQAANLELRPAVEPEPPAELLTMLEKRTAARNRRDWATADKLRDRIEARGWQVLDTPEGPVLAPARFKSSE